MVSITMRRCVAFIHDLDTTLTLDLKVKFIGFCRVFMTDLFENPDLFAFTLLMSLCPSCNFYLLWHKHTKFGTWVYHHERMCRVYSWSWYDVDLWTQGQTCRVYDMALRSGLSVFVLWNSHTLFGTWRYHHGTKCRVHSWTLIMNNIKIIFHHGFESGKLSLLFDIGIPHFGI